MTTSRNKDSNRMVIFRDPLLKKLEKIWMESEDRCDFPYWCRKFVGKMLRKQSVHKS